MQDLKDVTCDVHYENYRAEHISEQMTSTQRERGYIIYIYLIFYLPYRILSSDFVLEIFLLTLYLKYLCLIFSLKLFLIYFVLEIF